MSLSIVVPTFRRHTDLCRLLNSIYQLRETPESIVVIIGPGDTDSLNTVLSWAPKLPALHFIHAKRASVIHALNLGLLFAKEEIICLLDDDVWLPPDWSSKIKFAYATNVNMGAFGGRDYLQLSDPKYSHPPVASIVGTFTWKHGLAGNHHCGSQKSPVAVDVLKGCNLSFRRAAFPPLQIDPALEGHGAETCWEVDICLQVKNAGYDVIYDNENYVLHYASARLSFDNRGDLFSPAWTSRLYNEALIMAKYRPFFETFIYSFKAFFIGTRFIPGIVWAIILLSKHNLQVMKLPWKYSAFICKGILKGYSIRNKKS